jgi:DNA polymerase III epsilon subunit-like protein
MWINIFKKLYEKFGNKYKKLILIAHNAGYDFRFIQQYITIQNLCQSGNRLLECSGKFFYGKKSIDIIIKDSYSVISMSLSKFGKCFNLPQEKDSYTI